MSNIETLRIHLDNPDLDILTAVVMARRDLENGLVNSAVARLKVDLDKIRMHSTELYMYITTIF